MNLATSTLPNFGSGKISRLGTSRRRGITIPSVQLGVAHLDHPLRLPYYLEKISKRNNHLLAF